MSRFIENAVNILEAAENVMMTGQTPSPFSILLGAEGGIHIIAGSDWPLDSLQREHGAQSAYRVSPLSGRVSVDGREGSRTCHLETAVPAEIARQLLNAAPAWSSFVQPELGA